MEHFNRKSHWENIYESKPLETVSWYQPNPETSLHFVHQFNLPKTAKIIDIGGGDSFFVDHLLELDYEDITVMDISNAAIQRAKERLGSKSDRIKWIVSDVSDFIPTEQYDFWHDRAAFHFLTDKNEIENYVETTTKAIPQNGILVIGTFSKQGPTKCSGIEIKQYSEQTMTDLFQNHFQKIGCITIDHTTPSETNQNFVFCSFRKN
ncbi:MULTISPECIES: class I SAM-dependent methyltransferase [Bacteroidota]|uniref:Methyltransferase type 12 n=1 Tax=Flavobacterium johnsoniae (strain ATCC 17061 / DSM 2064 / JCM 8514 / BCRC 14874 / CCUG 350202 / NBRC 14942 / NCIMB 11054 / UW101) TaxID=376686 RepID=A5FFL7_FLAJ1|nr:MULTISPECIES: class I SAM-dependent methyltransferase [Bacteroidota]ABQ06010.1 Methyltransferase type 12 [Flavobacterium johnsoniae UW101]EJG02240.1 type 12 methyltransferase [Flavobacterium sp. F52]OXG00621.1 SAM-dependent methyltransferase [Flavobacterium johnsoniae UW101]WQG81746.1 class I SAM-dependent methyltransferase [Flavobacterium johnsoniae UW101]SHK63053.1 Nodulation protein S (NodS) [Flavobacterium johnsoniae]